ncbi:MAG: DUF1501 domain-containing protein [Planctomycetota bacterium]|nr:MAG: DUF1501 domain-containing protein [Planctomycetota bacterium]
MPIDGSSETPAGGRSPARLCGGPLPRRGVLTAGMLGAGLQALGNRGWGAGGLSLADLFRVRDAQASETPADDTAVIFVWLPGGPPHLETYDMKPEAPAEFRGAFRPIGTNVPGMDVCELLPLHARCADRYSIIRSISHDFADHGGGHKRFLTGRAPKEPTGFVNDFPMAGSFVSRFRPPQIRGLPSYTALVDGGRAHVDTFSFGAAYLGTSHTPFIVDGDPSTATFGVPSLSMPEGMERRLADRAGLSKSLDRLRRDLDSGSGLRARDTFDAKAIEILTSTAAHNAFDLSRESDAVRDRYGRHRFGQRALLARRLVEAGTTFVTVVMEHPGGEMPHNCCYNWDSHAVNCHIFDDAKWRMPFYDQAVTALVDDLYDRGLDKRVLLVVTGEFGRTPRIENQVGTQTKVRQPGRDHWPGAQSVLVAGGGLRTGQVIGSTDSRGGYPKDRPLSPNDLWATVYSHLGIDQELSVPDLAGRPMPILPFGEPIRELLG